LHQTLTLLISYYAYRIVFSHFTPHNSTRVESQPHTRHTVIDSKLLPWLYLHQPRANTSPLSPPCPSAVPPTTPSTQNSPPPPLTASAPSSSSTKTSNTSLALSQLHIQHLHPAHPSRTRRAGTRHNSRPRHILARSAGRMGWRCCVCNRLCIMTAFCVQPSMSDG
jgi:hypothetical protein